MSQTASTPVTDIRKGAPATAARSGGSSGQTQTARWKPHPRSVRRAIALSPFVVLVALLFVWPLVMLVIGGFRSASPFLPGHWTLEAWRTTFLSAGTVTAIVNSVKIAVISTTAATLIAAALAFLSERTDTPFRKLIMPAMLMVFVTPGLFYAVGFTMLANPYTGVLNDLIRHVSGAETPWLNVNGWGGIYTVLILKKVALTYLFLVGAFKALDATHDEAAYIVGAGPVKTFFHINLPSLSPAVTSVVLLGIVAGLQVFDPILILGASERIVVISTLLMNMAGGLGTGGAKYAEASVLSTAFVAFIALLYLGQLKVLGRRSFESLGGKGGQRRPFRMRHAGPIIGGLVLTYLLIAFVLPVGALILSSVQPYPGVYIGFSLDRYIEVLQFPRVAQALQVSLVLGVIVGGVTMTVAFAITEIGRTLGRKGYAAVRFATLIPFAMPGVVSALAISWAWLSLPGFGQFYGSIWLVILALIVVASPLATQIAASASSQISPALSEAARISGANRLQTFFEIVLVLALPSFLTGWFMSAMMVAGNLEVPLLLKSPGVNTLAVISYNLQTSGDYGQAAALLILLKLFTIALWLIILTLRRVLRNGGAGLHRQWRNLNQALFQKRANRQTASEETTL
ncbi:ABC transporter permease [Asticcacaulis tiandongensis]|uniref:ABC transporter permease n=1 Tax=Asticcacaulis tiandongensis TaxID=2565365 RepID=UPI001126A039|nr:ABC transporter permease subunit [Asticcacaulis tiandongensis]